VDLNNVMVGSVEEGLYFNFKSFIPQSVDGAKLNPQKIRR
jgi:hypothetical protein